ncbi:MAG: metallophosphoesterase [Planctomycetota bacterium]|jgi:predicted MPP superfamily phosphohydrolase
MPRAKDPARKRKARYRRARIRNFLFTVGPSRLSGGKISRRHLARDLEVRDITTASPAWPEPFDGLRIGHLSDFHLGELITIDRALEAVHLLAEQEPDLVACTGDVVDLHHEGAGPLLEAMAAIDAPLGTMLVLGNHDELHCPDTLSRMARDVGLVVLEDDAVRITRNGEALVVGGIGWENSAVGCARRLDRLRGDAVHVLLAHNPKAYLHASALGIPLTLSGHTHGGQVALKNRPNTSLALTHRHRAGLFEHGDSRLFVTTGVGAWFPLRVNCPAEVAVITMRHGAVVPAEPAPRAEGP